MPDNLQSAALNAPYEYKRGNVTFIIINHLSAKGTNQVMKSTFAKYINVI